MCVAELQKKAKEGGELSRRLKQKIEKNKEDFKQNKHNYFGKNFMNAPSSQIPQILLIGLWLFSFTI